MIISKNRTKTYVRKASTAGFCFGVKRAIELAERTAAFSKEKVYTFGPLIHNPQEVRRLERKGIKSIENIGAVKKATLIIRTHGIPAVLKKELESRELTLVDATCPFVKRAQDFVKELHKDGYQVIIIGEKTHPEVIALVSYANKTCRVIEKISDLNRIKLEKRIGVISQTTQAPEKFNEIVKALKVKRPDAKIYNTICMATIDRQSGASILAKKVGLMIVVGGKNSGNTRRLFEICSKFTETHAIETAKELKHQWFRGVTKAGLTAGASTPDWVIEEVRKKSERYIRKNNGKAK